MRTFISLFGGVVLMIAAGQAALAGGDKKQPVEDPKELTVVAYDSKTHGAVQVKSASANPGDWFQVFKNGKNVFSNPELLNGRRELAPGAYVVVVNRTERKVTIEAGKLTILLTGDLMVESKRDGHYWIPKQGKETKLASNPPVVNTRVALFPGTYSVHVQTLVQGELRNLGMVEVKAGKKTVVKE
jgi:hypothetical protein